MGQLQDIFAKPDYSKMGFLEKLTHTWPARTLQELFNAAKLPGEVYAGQTQVFDPSTGRVNQNVINRSADLAGGVTLGAGAVPASRNTLRSGASMLRQADDLPMDQASRMARARDMGFDVDNPVYHGSADNFAEFSNLHLGKSTGAKSGKAAHWLSTSPETANGYADLASEYPVSKLIRQSEAAERAGQWDKAHSLMVRAEKLEAEGGQGQNILPAMVRGKIKSIDMDGMQYDPDDVNLSQILTDAKASGFDGVRLQNFSDEAGYGNYNPTEHIAVFDPANIRSRFAKFDPANKNSRNLMAGTAGAAVLAATASPDQAQAQQQNDSLGDILANALKGRL